jgi:hypothetical protein
MSKYRAPATAGVSGQHALDKAKGKFGWVKPHRGGNPGLFPLPHYRFPTEGKLTGDPY